MNKPVVVNVETKKPNWVNAVVSSISRRIDGSVFGVSKNGKRDITQIYGYKERYTFQCGYAMWRRGGLAFRIVNSVARSSWRDGITVLRGKEVVLAKELKILNRHGKMTKRLEQADILNRIGSFSVLFVGVPDGLDFSKPLGVSNKNRLDEVYFRAYSEDGVTISKWVTEASDPRYGLPEEYTLQVTNSGDKEVEVSVTPIIVHWSRVVHLSEGSLDSDVEGIPALEPVFNTLEDIVKTTGGSAEAYFRNARNRFSMQTDPKFATSFDAKQKAQLQEEAEAFQNDWQDFIRAGGIDIKALNIPHASPADTFMVLLKVVSGTTGIPIRILTGEGGGQLAGNEDKESYNQIIQDRRDLDCTEWMSDLLTILDNANMLVFSDADDISWETPNVVSGKDKAAIAKDAATALQGVAIALSSPALDGVLEVDSVMRLIFGEESAAEIKITSDDGLTDEELADAEINPAPIPKDDDDAEEEDAE